MPRPKGGSIPPPQVFVNPGDGGLISELNENDVLSGRGGRINNHPGNITFRRVVEDYKREYLDPSIRKLEKAHLAARLVAQIRAADPPGRFLREDSDNPGMYVEIGDQKAWKKAGQALREDAPDVRKELDEEIKDVDDVMNNNPYSSPQQHHMQYPSLQAKKVVKNIEFSRSINEGNGGGYSILVKVLTAKNKELEAKVGTLESNIRAKDNEIVELKRKIAEMTAPAPTPAPKQRHPPTHQGLNVVGGAARGAAGVL